MKCVVSCFTVICYVCGFQTGTSDFSMLTLVFPHFLRVDLQTATANNSFTRCRSNAENQKCGMNCELCSSLQNHVSHISICAVPSVSSNLDFLSLLL